MPNRFCFLAFVFFCAVAISGCGGGGSMSDNTTGIAPTGLESANPLAAGTQVKNTGEISGKIAVPPAYANKTEVRAYIPGTSFSDYSDENGNFSIPGVPVGSYSVICEAPGLMPFQMNGIGVGMQKTTEMGLVMLQMMGSQEYGWMQGMMGSQGSEGMKEMMNNQAPAGIQGMMGF